MCPSKGWKREVEAVLVYILCFWAGLRLDGPGVHRDGFSAGPGRYGHDERCGKPRGSMSHLGLPGETLVFSLLLVAMPGAPNSFLLLVAVPGAPGSVLARV